MKPLLLDYSINRKGSVTPIFNYDNNLNLNVIQINGEQIPFVDSKLTSMELLTKTKAERESDDEEYSLLELQTMTEVLPERDDEERARFLELETKTYVEREKDDEDDPYLAELMTKTAQEREKDDDDIIFN